MALDNAESIPFDEKFARYDEALSPGLAAMVIQDGVTKYKKGFGHSNLTTKQKIDCDTNFRMASVSKQFTAMAVAILEERGQIARNDCISQYLPDVPEYMREIEVWHLIHHLSGLPDYADALCSSDQSKPLVSNHDVYDYYKKQNALDFAVGERHEYSNGGYSLLALVVENAAEQLFKDFCKGHIFIPAGMKNTEIIEYPSTIRNQAISYSEWPFFDDIDFNTGNALQGEDGVFTSLNDMESWLLSIDSNKLVSDSTTQKIFSPVQTHSGESVKYGYGWEWDTCYSMDMIVHGGSWVGFNTVVAKFPERNTWFVGFSNTEAISSDKAVLAMVDHYLGKEPAT